MPRSKSQSIACLRCVVLGAVLWFCWLPGHSPAQDPAVRGSLLSTEGKVEYSPQRAAWAAAVINQKLTPQDRVRTLTQSRAMVQLAELGRVRLDELTTLEILPPRNPQSKGTLDLKAGAMYFFTRERPREFEVQTPKALAASRGTEFLVTLDPDGRERFVVYDGEVELTNALGSVVVLPGELGIVETGQPPRKTAVIESQRTVQWWLYYPAVLDPSELSFTPDQSNVLRDSLAAYQQGDLLRALASYPTNRVPANADEHTYLAALLLSVGQVAQADEQLSAADATQPAARALRLMMDTVQGREAEPLPDSKTATEWLANSYAQQARYNLTAALAAARKATEHAPQFGFAFARRGELEFGFGRTREATAALEWALTLSPRNAQAWALQGFLHSAERDWGNAASAFDQAITCDPALGNAWLGRGLLKLRTGEREAGRADLQTAAALEPRRSLLRSYLGKAFDEDRDEINARRELELAKQLDAQDPTPWLYSALILRGQLRYNEAITELEKSARLNDNRQVYRSRLMLDQDQAVRSASLATIYRAAGMDDVSVREAARAVTYDYANHSAHRFLAESFDALRDPTRFNLRNETVWFNELLLANLLAPVGAGNLSQNISQQEYSRLFERDGLHLNSMTEYRSDGQFREIASQFGTLGKLSYALDVDYQHNDGVRPNNELDRLESYFTAKYQLRATDSLFLLAKYQDYSSGDNFQYYDPNATRPDLEPFGLTNAPVIRTNYSFDEVQDPVVLGGWHHEWSPGVHTLFLGGRLVNDQQFSDTAVKLPIFVRPPNTPTAVDYQLFDLEFRNAFEIYTAELNQIIQTERHFTVAGGRFQHGTIERQDRLTLVNTNLGPFFLDPPAAGDFADTFERITAYLYHTWELWPDFLLTGGAAYDRVTAPVNNLLPPLSPGTTTRDELSPKAALVWSPNRIMTLRGAYTRSLGGASFDESYRLEPTQLAGFSQAFRTLIPESLVGSVIAPTYETAGLALDLKFPTRTYVGVQAEYLQSEVDRTLGGFEFTGLPPVVPSSTKQSLDYTEPSVLVTLNQLLSDEWSVGAQYRFTRSQLDTRYPEIPSLNRSEEADLHQARAFLLWNHRSGFFGRFESLWFHQENRGYTPTLPGDDFFQHNLFVGYRLKRQRAEITFGVLNLTDTDYRLNPLNAYAELPRERTFLVRFKFSL